jgi:hypothetical protein
MYQVALDNYAQALAAWEARHPNEVKERGTPA